MSDTIVPLPSSSRDVGLTPQHTPSGEPVTIDYKGDEYNGFSSNAAVTIPGTSITDINLPVISVQKQSPDLVGINPNLDGIFGFAYTSLSNHHPQTTAMDVLYTSGVIPNNEIGLQLCPYEMTSNSFINIGNTDVTAKCGTDGTSIAWVQSPSDNHFAINIKSILVNDEKVNLPEEFQKKVENGRTLYSSVETCFLHMRFPEVVVATLINAILDSGAITVNINIFSDKLGKVMVKKIFSQNYAMLESGFDIDWGKLPTLSITMFAQNPVTDANLNSVVTIKLGPKDYIQRVDSKNFRFAIKAGPNDNAILGIPFMAQLGLTFDRAHKRIGFGAGCGCEVATSKYPTISNGYRVLWPSSHVRLPEQPSTSGSSGTFIRRRKP
ncbi:hypothetical protein BATDEDRAFT_92765 [Batrachochytrium dendrobatidis JAM81]|uniref:Peptidase A1 domain-containing protein n=1 Tax=Batrachochytrium dendrobatidis (strain JAM81 / FGSC 10211) TaxID=684364 RepID=F4PEB0_BATDJ|nr:uncharacterized protein BATDEDRAFT_92765 [Batrachochytrium dendrobatidis JAM81]EGF76390.1 hypothetical protein BATDEDRAFT_92765 [Batrachochytrium dendrobatidis JAM81]|eukprot:XP_006683008.1 hypothetical protein BATDEDRAFT_92765 [Batrachochytrium dendrobatidis JAM81]